MQQTGPRAEHVRLCLQFILQAHLHQLDAGLTEEKVLELCTEVGLPNMPETHERRLAALQVLAARLLPHLT
jgi:hypothetical protein